MISLFPIIDFFSRHPVYHEYEKLKQSQWKSPADIHRHQLIKLEALLAHASQHVPYYRDLFPTLHHDPRESFDAIPVLDRNLLRENVSKILAENRGPADRHKKTSSGTTSNPVTFYLDNRLIPLCRAVEKRANFEWTGAPFWGRKVVLWGQLGKERKVLQGLGEWLRKRWVFFYHKASDEQVGKYVKKLSHIKPYFILGYASALRRTAEYILAHDVRSIRPHSILSGAEVLSPDTRALVEKAFGCKVYNCYGSSEFGYIANECPHGNLHVNAERVYLEIVRDGKAVPPGEEGDIVITDLDNVAFPLIRYAVGDIGILSPESCSCGRGLPVLQSLLGRSIDYLQTPSGVPIRVSNVLAALFREANTDRQIQAAQVVQVALSTVIIRIIPGPTFTSDTESKGLAALRSILTDDITISFEYVSAIEPAPSGKIRPFIALTSSSPQGTP